MSVSFLFLSHSDNSDLWLYLSKIISKISYSYKIYIAIEEDVECRLNTFHGILRYDDTLTYDQKLITLFNKISSKYIVLIHDNDLLIEFDNDLFKNLINTMETKNIDRCIFGVAANAGPCIYQLSDEDSICRINNIESLHFRTPYDVGPSVWNKQSFLNALETIPNTSYREIEDSPIQDYCKNKLNIYGFVTHKSIKSYYVVGRPFYYKFQFLHIFTRRQLMYPQMYMDQEENLWKILAAYPEIKKRGILEHIINIHLRTV
jgi:hypothetical protein